ncbi:Na-translocating system protein MpsC family protein [Sutcliffiella cohnii]|uniref:Na-translocating system protein MpsC family protein n=1 Tax=Sutcliffiella cohnii TaxID=33932 RepID=UPI002E1FC487|nr:Na-translocating system protein MpsC family protein [Sutcliffiella cohnii]
MSKDPLNFLSSYTSKLLRKNFGRGPQSCQTTLKNSHLVIYIKGFLSPMEEVLMQQGQRDQVDKARTIIIEHLIKELVGVIRLTIERDVEESYHDWNFPNNSGILMFKLKESEDVQEEEDIQDSIDDRVELEELAQEVARISKLVQKVPEQIIVYPLSKTIYLLERKGLLVPIEKALIAKGYKEELKITKDELEKKYFHRHGKFNEIFLRPIKDIFIDWNLKEDKSLMGFILFENEEY